MSNVAKLKPAEAEPISGLALLRKPFESHQISKLPKETKQQADERKAGKNAIRCTVCGGYHHKNAVHLDYVGHAALTDRLLDVDPEWRWEPMGFAGDGQPAFDRNGGMWIKLTVCGVTRLGYGAADGKTGGDAVKEIIGDALRNAAMRFGAALDLWHKGDLHADNAGNDADTGGEPSEASGEPDTTEAFAAACKTLEGITHPSIFKETWAAKKDGWKAALSVSDYVSLVDVMKRCAAKVNKPTATEQIPIIDDEIPF